MSEETRALTMQQPDLSAIERVIVAGDLSKLTQDERWSYYQAVCRSVDLNPFTQPFAYLNLKGKLTLYALKGATDQLRGKHRISIGIPHIDMSDGLCIVTVTATDANGRQDSDMGIVPMEGLRGEDKANAILKSVTKAKRRVTLSMLGLGMLDETEVETIPGARVQPAELPPVDSAPRLSAPLVRDDVQRSTGEIIDAEVIAFPFVPFEEAALNGIKERLAENPGNFEPPSDEAPAKRSDIPSPALVQRYKALMDEAKALSMDQSPYAVNYATVTGAELLEQGVELKAAIDKQRAAQQTLPV